MQIYHDGHCQKKEANSTTPFLEIKGNCEVIGRQTFPLFLTHRLGVLLQFMELWPDGSIKETVLSLRSDTNIRIY